MSLSAGISRSTKAFTIVELLSVIVIIAALAAMMVPVVGNYVAAAKRTADEQTLSVLNDALTRYKTQGGNLGALTLGTPVENVLALLQTPVSWAGLEHQFLSDGASYDASLIAHTGVGSYYRFSGYDSFGDAPVEYSVLDTYSNGVVGAYAMHLLDNSYSGPVVRVRRSSDSAERDFYASELNDGSWGGELVTNGDFSAGTNNWEYSGGGSWSIADGQVTGSGVTQLSYLNQSFPVTVGDTYVLSYKVIENTLVGDTPRFGMSAASSFSNVTYFTLPDTVGSHSYLMTCMDDDTTDFRVFINNTITSGNLIIDDISVKRVDLSTVESWVGEGNDGFVTTWYDQSGNGYDLVQATTGSQPTLVNSGALVEVNGRAAIRFDGSDDYLSNASLATSVNNSSFFVLKRNNTDSFRVFADSHTTSPHSLSCSDGSFSSYCGGTTDQTMVVGSFTNAVVSLVKTGTVGVGVVNGISGTVDNGSSGYDGFRVGALRSSAAYPYDGYMQAAIVYDGDMSTSRAGIEGDLNRTYNVY